MTKTKVFGIGNCKKDMTVWNMPPHSIVAVKDLENVTSLSVKILLGIYAPVNWNSQSILVHNFT